MEQPRIINNRIFTPIEILTSYIEENTDSNENQIVHGFISELIRFIISLRKTLLLNLNKCNKKYFTELIEYYSIVRNIEITKNVLKNLNEIKYLLNEYIPVSNEKLDFFNTNKLSSKEHYEFVFNNLILWLNSKDAIFVKEKKVFKGISEGRVTVDKSAQLPTGTYFYILDLKDGSDVMKGYIYLTR